MRVPLLNFEGGPGVLLLNFEGGPRVPLLNFRRVPGPEVPGSWSHFYTMPDFVKHLINSYLFRKVYDF